jgi:hypothetical protein
MRSLLVVGTLAYNRFAVSIFNGWLRICGLPVPIAVKILPLPAPTMPHWTTPR